MGASTASAAAKTNSLLLGLAIGARQWHWVDASRIQDGRSGAKGVALCGAFCGWVSLNQWSEGPSCTRCRELGEGRGAVKQGSLF